MQVNSKDRQYWNPYVGGFLLGVVMWLGRDWVITLLVPSTAVAIFLPAWALSAASQPFNSFAFLTDGVHWGTGDYRFLRNVMIAATVIATMIVSLTPGNLPGALNWVWAAIFLWVLLRGILGMLRIFPGIGNSPFATRGQTAIQGNANQ